MTNAIDKAEECAWGFHVFSDAETQDMRDDPCHKCGLTRGYLESEGREAAEIRVRKLHQGPTAQEVREAYGKPDPYTAHRVGIDAELTLVAMSSRPGNEAARLRNIAALRRELDRPLPKPSRHDARPRDLEQAWATPGWEEG